MTEEVIDYLLRLSGVGLAVVGLNAGASFFFGFDFLSDLPGFLETFTYLGGFIGAIDTSAWAFTKKELTDLY